MTSPCNLITDQPCNLRGDVCGNNLISRPECSPTDASGVQRTSFTCWISTQDATPNLPSLQRAHEVTLMSLQDPRASPEPLTGPCSLPEGPCSDVNCWTGRQRQISRSTAPRMASSTSPSPGLVAPGFPWVLNFCSRLMAHHLVDWPVSTECAIQISIGEHSIETVCLHCRSETLQ